MTADNLKTKIRKCLALARREEPELTYRRARAFVACLSGSLEHDDAALSEELFALLKNEPVPAVNPEQAVIIYGPQGCGKTRNAATLAAFYGKAIIAHDWVPGDKLMPNVLALTCVPNVPGAIEFTDAMEAWGGTLV